jgi:hypothetical protein
LLLILVIAYGAWCLLLYMVQGSMLYLPRLAGPPTTDRLIPPHVRRLWIEPEPGVRVEGWLLLPRVDGSDPLVVLTHGNAELIDHCLDDAERWMERGYAVLLPEFRGYGRSGGRPGQEAIVRDVAALIAIAVKEPGIAPGPVILHGRSLGSGVAAQVAMRVQPPPAALVLESPFTSVAGFAWRYGVSPLLVTNPYRTDRVLPTLSCPILILHSEHDEIVPFAHGERLATLNPRARLIRLHGSHNAGLSSQTEYWAAIDELLAGVRR